MTTRSKAAPSASRRDRILDAGMQLFAAKGLHGATVKDIADAAGIAQGLLYHYFPNKEAVLVEIVRSRGFLPELREILRDAPPDRPIEDVLRRIAHGFADVLGQRDALMRIIIREAQGHPDIAAPFGAMIGEGVGALSAFLDTRIRTGELKPHDTSVAARTIMFAVVMGQLSRTGDRSFRDGLIDMLLSGIRA